MDSTDGKKPECDEDCDCKDCEMKMTTDDDSIQVSVIPRRFGLPPSTEKKTKMEIKNKNPYPIYFKASTSNMDAFRPVPTNGRITPNGKASVDVQFYDSAVPIKRHEEVIIFTSVKPFEQYTLYKERMCPFCMESFDFSKHHRQKRHFHGEDFSSEQEHHSYGKHGKSTRYEVDDRKHMPPESKRMAEYHQYYEEEDLDDYVRKYEIPQQKMKTEYEEKQKRQGASKIHEDKIEDDDRKHMPPESKRKAEYHQYYEEDHDDYVRKYEIPQQKMKTEYEEKQKRQGASKIHEDKEREEQFKDYPQKFFKTSEERKVNSDEALYKNSSYSTERIMYKGNKHELKEICIHAMVHQPADSNCRCKNCIELGREKDDRKQWDSEKHRYERKIKSDESVSEQKFRGIEKDTYTTHHAKDTHDRTKMKGKEAHILARVFSDENNKRSDTTISDLSRMDNIVRKTKIISEDECNRKREKMKKKLQKRYEEKTESTTAAEQQKEYAESLTKMERKSMLQVVEDKCTTLLKLTWANLFLLMILICIVVGGLFWCCRSEDLIESRSMFCLRDLFQNFG